MEEFIKNIAARRSEDGSISLSWVWPTGYDCLRVVFLHKLGGRDPAALSPEELSEVSDLCFMDEFRIAGGRYVYPVGPGDAGLLKFRVCCCAGTDSTDFERCSGTAQITGITIGVRWASSEKKSGKTYKKVMFTLSSDAGIPAGSLAYRTVRHDALFPIDRAIPKGESQIGPVILEAEESAVLGLAPGHEDEFEVTRA